MQSLFDREFDGQISTRKYEPLIRFDADGNPQPRRPMSQTAVPDMPAKPIQTETKNEIKKTTNEPVAKKPPPGKQQKLTAFFTKK